MEGFETEILDKVESHFTTLQSFVPFRSPLFCLKSELKSEKRPGKSTLNIFCITESTGSANNPTNGYFHMKAHIYCNQRHTIGNPCLLSKCSTIQTTLAMVSPITSLQVLVVGSTVYLNINTKRCFDNFFLSFLLVFTLAMQLMKANEKRMRHRTM